MTRSAFPQLQRLEQEVTRVVGVMTRPQLRRALEETKRITPDNCSLVMFELRTAAAHLINVELIRRDRRRRQLPLL
jgi:hypothetical protein